MAISWFQLVGGSFWGVSGRVISGAAESRASGVYPELAAEIMREYDGAAWLAQGGYERVSLGLEFRVSKKGRALRSVNETGRLVNADFSIVWPELETASVEEIRTALKPAVLEALELVGERKNLGKLPLAGAAGRVQSEPLKPLVEDPLPYGEQRGDSFIITRELPPGLGPEDTVRVFAQYEADLEALLSEEALEHVIETETSPTAIRWLVQLAAEPAASASTGRRMPPVNDGQQHRGHTRPPTPHTRRPHTGPTTTRQAGSTAATDCRARIPVDDRRLIGSWLAAHRGFGLHDAG